ncbi:MAG: T9SS type A sorting domain-containing protein [Bacteroidetes bacterium]|nr:T9SS type A sorting domain-containing protein [Bacteroidota bacterium]MCB0852093.1 T9SS type A sorting domain-containing protein [Bacteroidota bacterium]
MLHTEFQVWDQIGKLVSQGNIRGPKAGIDLTHLANGVYYLHVNLPDKGRNYGKIVIQR